jgi:uncharacterized protein
MTAVLLRSAAVAVAWLWGAVFLFTSSSAPAQGVPQPVSVLASQVGPAVAVLQSLPAAQALPALTAHVTDSAKVLSAVDLQGMEQKLAAYETATGHQLAVLIVPSLQGEPLETLSLRVVEQWKLGDAKRDDGLLVLVAVEDRQVRIEVGYGLEGAIPDVLAGRVISGVMTPRFRQRDYAGGLNAGLDALMAAGRGENVGASIPAAQDTDRAPLMVLLVVLLVVLNGMLGSVPRKLRSPLVGVAGGVAGLVMWGVGAGALLALLGLMMGLFQMRGLLWVMAGLRGGRGGAGGFGGGGGGFGGGGASGRW